MSQSAPSPQVVVENAQAPEKAPADSPKEKGGDGQIPTHFSSLEDLKNEAPEVYNLMMMTIAQSICSQMKHQNDTLRKLIREGRRNS